MAKRRDFVIGATIEVASLKKALSDGSELTTYKEKNHLVGFCTDIENYTIHNQTPQHYGKYVPLVHVFNYGNYHGDTLVRLLLLRHPCIFCILLKLVHHS